MCTKEAHILEQDVVDAYGISHLAGDKVISAFYYQFIPGTIHKYKYVEDKSAFVPVDSIGVRFSMT